MNPLNSQIPFPHPSPPRPSSTRARFTETRLGTYSRLPPGPSNTLKTPPSTSVITLMDSQGAFHSGTEMAGERNFILLEGTQGSLD